MGLNNGLGEDSPDTGTIFSPKPTSSFAWSQLLGAGGSAAKALRWAVEQFSPGSPGLLLPSPLDSLSLKKCLIEAATRTYLKGRTDGCQSAP